MGEHTPSYVVGSSYSLADLSDDERKHLDTAPWVFACNSFLSHWEAAGFRPTVWCYGDNHSIVNVQDMEIELATYAEDVLLQQRLVHTFVAAEEYPKQAQAAICHWGLPVRTYRRGQPWNLDQGPATDLDGKIYHCGSTLTNLVNFAAILNPGQDIRLIGCEYGFGFGHFWEGECPARGQGLPFWRRVKNAMWTGLYELHHRWGYPLVDCNTHPNPLPKEFRIPTGKLLD